MWQAMAISQPPPRAWPLIAATTGLGKRSMRRSTLLPKRMKGGDVRPVKAEPRSAPAQKIRSPAPGDDDGAHGVVGLELGQGRVQLAHQRLADRVGGRPVQGDDGEALLAGQDQGLVRPSGGCSSGRALAADGHAPEEEIGHRGRGVDEPVPALAQHPRRGHLVHGAEQRLGGDLDGTARTGSAPAPRPPRAPSRSARSTRRSPGSRRRGRTSGPAAARPGRPRRAPDRPRASRSGGGRAADLGHRRRARRRWPCGDATKCAIFSRKSVTRMSSLVLK